MKALAHTSTEAGSGIDQSTTGRHIPALDGVRGTALLLILLLHLFTRNPTPNAALPVRVVSRLFAAGWTGVDLFFVLSGFLITGILYDTRETPHFFRNFYARRALRIFPLYYGFLLLIVALTLSMGYRWNPTVLAQYLTYTHNLPLRGTPYTTAPWVNINHFWSLAIEEQFYLVWPALVFFLATKRRIVAAAMLLATASLGLRFWCIASGLTQTAPYVIYSWTPARLDGLLLGAALAVLLRSRWRGAVLRWSPVVFATGAVAVLILLFWLPRFEPLDSPFVATFGYVLLSLTFCGLVGSSLRQNGAIPWTMRLGFLQMLGRYSYGIYVVHYTLHQVLTPPVHGFVETHTHSKLLALLASGSVTFVASVVLAGVSFRYFESPVLRLKRYFHSDGGKPKLRSEAAMAERAS